MACFSIVQLRAKQAYLRVFLRLHAFVSVCDGMATKMAVAEAEAAQYVRMVS